MKSLKKVLFGLLFIFPCFAFAQWEENFENASLRIDYYHSGRFKVDYFTIESYEKLPFYAGSHTYLIDNTNNGAYKVALFDRKTHKMIFSKGFSSLFNEWQSSKEAETMCGNYEETVIVPYPKNEVDIVFFSRDSINNWQEVAREKFDEDKVRLSEHKKYNIIPLHEVNRPVEKRMDLVFLPIGYTKGEAEKMIEDLKNFTQWMFVCEPYKGREDVINIEAVEYYSNKSGIPGLGERKNEDGELGVSYNMFSSPRYIMTTHLWELNDVLSCIPFDAVIIVVNSATYGGGGIYNYYATCYNGAKAKEVLIHEFSHSFAGLADEYADNDSDSGLQPIEVEPYEKNITTLVDFGL
ncbi:MAG: hypothetical protein IJ748_07545, partial [Bacteroidales bacterium]|nr:hypothetical protein [Bacteroidales bacterium]